jgi:hypothetical protein
MDGRRGEVRIAMYPAELALLASAGTVGSSVRPPRARLGDPAGSSKLTRAPQGSRASVATRARSVAVRRQLERIDALLIARDGPRADGNGRGSLDRKIEAARRESTGTWGAASPDRVTCAPDRAEGGGTGTGGPSGPPSRAHLAGAGSVATP